MNNALKSVPAMAEILIATGARTATKYWTEKLTTKVSRPKYKGKPSRRQIELVVTIGPPNYAERGFIKSCKKAGEPFPVRKIQLRGLPT